jgi:hypothetical protein
MVVFTTGMKPLGNDEFYVFYGAADSDVGVSRIKVNVKGDDFGGAAAVVGGDTVGVGR